MRATRTAAPFCLWRYPERYSTISQEDCAEAIVSFSGQREVDNVQTFQLGIAFALGGVLPVKWCFSCSCCAESQISECNSVANFGVDKSKCLGTLPATFEQSICTIQAGRYYYYPPME